MTHQHSRWRSTLALILAALLALFAIAGYYTAGSLQAPGYQTAGKIYVGLFFVSILAMAGLVFFRRRGRHASRSAI